MNHLEAINTQILLSKQYRLRLSEIVLYSEKFEVELRRLSRNRKSVSAVR